MLDSNGSIRYFNHSVDGCQPPRIGQHWTDVLPSPWHAQLHAALQTVHNSRRPFEYELQETHRSDPRWFCLRICPIEQEERTIGFTLSFNDITRLKLSQERLRRDYSRFQALTDAVPGGIFQTDEEGRVIFVTRRFEEIVGHSRAQIQVPEQYTQLVHPDDREAAWAHWQEASRTISRFEREVRIVRENGHRHVLIVAEPVFKGLEQAGGFIGFVMAITDAKAAEDALRSREAELHHVSRLATMGQMTAELAHEINQPLYSISNYAHAISHRLSSLRDDQLEEPFDDQLKEQFEEVIAWADRIAHVAQDAGHITRRLRSFTSAGMSEPIPFDLVQAIREAVEMLEWDMRRFGVHLDLVGFDEPVTVRADRIEIQQVVVNLVKNAIESLADVPQDIRHLKIVVDADCERVTVRILDRGIGLPVDDPEKLFPAFVTYKPRGTGMGLAVSRTIVERFGGKMSGAARDEGGAEFTFFLPRVS